MASKMENELTAEKMARPVGKALQLILKHQVASAPNVGNEIERIATALNRKPKTIQSLIYENKGGFSLRVAAVIKAFDLSEEQIEAFFENLTNHLKKINPIKQSDKNWIELDPILSEAEKCNWTEAIKVLKQLELKLEKE